MGFWDWLFGPTSPYPAYRRTEKAEIAAANAQAQAYQRFRSPTHAQPQRRSDDVIVPPQAESPSVMPFVTGAVIGSMISQPAPAAPVVDTPSCNFDTGGSFDSGSCGGGDF
jgi:hypothetical protein